MPDPTPDAAERTPVPVIYVADFRDSADWFDLAYLLRSPAHVVRGVSGFPDPHRLAALTELCGKEVAVSRDFGELANLLAQSPEPVNLVSTGDGHDIDAILVGESVGEPEMTALFREKVARLFLVGGHANDYGRGRAGERLPIDPRLKESNPERFLSYGDGRIAHFHRNHFAALLTSGEAVIWLPRDICLWRFAAFGMLADGGPVSDFLLERLREKTGDEHSPVLLSSLPAFLLAVQPDPFAWMRLFRAVPARVELDETGAVSSIATQTDRPNLYAVIAIDGAALSKAFAGVVRQ